MTRNVTNRTDHFRKGLARVSRVPITLEKWDVSNDERCCGDNLEDALKEKVQTFYCTQWPNLCKQLGTPSVLEIHPFGI